MKRFIPILLSIVMVLFASYVVFIKKHQVMMRPKAHEVQANIGVFERSRPCVKLPDFLKRMKIKQPVVIDLSQKKYKGIALYHGKKLQKVLHPKMWEKYGHFGTYALDKQGNIFLAPTPYISIKEETFNLQRNIYKLNSKSGKLDIFMHFDDVHPSAYNPYGITSLVYDCDDHTLWVSAIDETSYEKQRGVIYHIDIKTKTILQKIEGLDALTLSLVSGKEGKHLLVGASRESALYAYKIVNNRVIAKPEKLFTLVNANEYIRKIKIKSKNRLELQTVPFMYSLVVQTAKKDRRYYRLIWNEEKVKWSISYN
ncbi:MAG: hypothetical protein U9O24_00070 [Campylobacterota bacterium]|nr:hypothetical protein [Campylobacterota bacterium]